MTDANRQWRFLATALIAASVASGARAAVARSSAAPGASPATAASPPYGAAYVFPGFAYVSHEAIAPPAGSDAAAAPPAPTLRVATVPVDVFADIAVLAPDERIVYVTGFQENLIEAINLRTLRITRRFRVPDRIWALAISPDGQRLFVSTTPFPVPPSTQCQGVLIAGPHPSQLLMLDAFSGAVLQRARLPAQALNLLPSPDGSALAAVTNTGVELVDLTSGTELMSLAAPAQDLVGEAAFDFATISAAGDKVFAASPAHGVAVFDLAHGSAHDLAPPPAGYQFVAVGIASVAADATVFTSLLDGGGRLAVEAVDAVTEKARTILTATTLAAMGGVLFSHRDAALFFPSSGVALHASNLAVAGHFQGGFAAQLSPDESLLYVRPHSAPGPATLSLFSPPVPYDLAVIDTATLQVLVRIPLDDRKISCTAPTPLLIGPSGRVLVAPNPALKTVSVIRVTPPASSSAARD